MELDKAIEIMEKALNAANKAGVFNLQDSATVHVAMETVKQMYVNTLAVETKPVVKPKVEKVK